MSYRSREIEAAEETFAVKVKEVAAPKDLEALAELAAFLVYVGLTGIDMVETKEDFLECVQRLLKI